MKIAAIQHDIAWEDPRANFEHLAPRIAAAAAAGVQLALLSEMFSTGFSMETDKTAEGAEGMTASFLVDQARAHGLYVGGSFTCRESPGELAVNRFLIAAPDGATFHYDKIHPFNYGGENKYFSPGVETITIEIESLRVTPFVCYDLRFADVFWNAALRTDCYVIVANWPSRRQQHWSTLCRAAIENQAYVVAVNRVGRGGGIDYTGGSLVVEPFGEVLAEGGAGEVDLVAEVSAGRVNEVRARYPFLADR